MNDARYAALGASSLHAFVLSACILAGCRPALTEDYTSGRIDTDPAAVAAAREVQLVTVDREGFDALIEKQRGRVVLVDFWATWCGPCVEQLPHTIKLAKRLAERGLTVVTVSLDDPAGSEQVSEFLRSQGAGAATNLISQLGASPQSMDAFDIAGGAVPHYKLYDRRGGLRHTFGVNPTAQKQFTQHEIDAAIEGLLSE
jgi:thiol-disulfide isomerase/thioredoxin